MNITEVSPPAIAAVLMIAWAVIFLLSLAHALGRTDIDPVTRLTWVVVLIFVPFFGIVLYALSARPDQQPRDASGSDVFGTPWANNPSHLHSDSKD